MRRLAFLFIAAAVACSDPVRNISIPPVNTPVSEAPHFQSSPVRQQAQVGYGQPQKLVFIGSGSQYFNLPQKWNAVQLRITADTTEGVIELPDGRTIRWSEGMFGSDLDEPDTEVIWKRTDLDASVVYGVIRRPDGVLEFQALSTGDARVVFSTPASCEPLGDIVSFVTPITIHAPCRDCVIPAARK